ncbi:hypothetical protein SAMN04487928_1243 [Butyrivibrio proteoclasticus]|uniref:SH3b domain-containing protein n=1 Tax=Butyrivibrio proteoclasticus TaxID=43305 RepID=A0A1I5WNU8_9FIRM|nr:SH3 domain-containing protein [Butyrivibrio proteoclasticus]SFQ21251.1 hypothetical protein SAMN04487928_1243 [Butyrivibrio proteoclasticus]
MNKKTKIIIIVLAVMVVGGAVFGIYKYNAAQVEQVAEAQETIDVDALAETYYNENKANIKSDTTLEDWKTVFKDYWASTNGNEAATVADCLNYFAPDTILPGDVDDPESMEVKVDKEDADIVNAEMLGDDDNASEEESVETVEVEANEATTEASTTDASTDTITNTKDFEVDYYDKSKTMYAIRSVNVRKGPDANDFEKVLTLKTNDAVEVIGVVDEYNGKEVYWTAVKINGQEYYISGVYLSDSKVQTTTSSGNSSTSNSSQQQQSSGSQQQSSNSNTSSESSAADKLRGIQEHQLDVQSGGSGDGVAVGDQGINWH